MKLNESVYGCILVSSKGNVCLVQGKKTCKWSFPKGHLNRGETPFQCASRETREETGIQIPWQTHRPIKLVAGWYYIIFVDKEYSCDIFDQNEIIQVGWFSIEEVQQMRGNVDVSAFLKRIQHTPEGSIWTLLKRRCMGHGFYQQSQRCTQIYQQQ
jgi:NADH pyrophosphatase NudC (nudix superfamily)